MALTGNKLYVSQGSGIRDDTGMASVQFYQYQYRIKQKERVDKSTLSRDNTVEGGKRVVLSLWVKFQQQ